MKKLFTAIAALLTISAIAQTNFFERLKVGNALYQNVRIITNTPSYVVAFYDGGAAHFAFSNLPPGIQKQYGYDPKKESQYLSQQKQLKEKQKQAERNAAIQRQKLEITKQQQLAEIAKSNFKEVEILWTNYFGGVSGVVKNNTTNEYEDINVEFAFSRGDHQGGTDSKWTHYLGPLSTWEFFVRNRPEWLSDDARLVDFNFRKKKSDK